MIFTALYHQKRKTMVSNQPLPKLVTNKPRKKKAKRKKERENERKIVQ